MGLKKSKRRIATHRKRRTDMARPTLRKDIVPRHKRKRLRPGSRHRLILIGALAGVLVALVLIILLTRGGKQPDTVEGGQQTSIAITAAQSPGDTPMPTPTALSAPEMALGESVFAHFDGENDSTLYAATEIKNNGQSPFIIEQGTVKFMLSDGTEIPCDYTPPGKTSDIIAPGETGYAALWYVYNKPLGEELTVQSVAFELTPQVSDNTSIPLSVEDTEIVSNLSGYTEVSGRVRNASGYDCYANVIYLAFYDTQQKLLGVYEFCVDGSFKNRQVKSFDMDMKFMPIPTIAVDAIEIRSRGVGIR